jgi:hypothetical protein
VRTICGRRSTTVRRSGASATTTASPASAASFAAHSATNRSAAFANRASGGAPRSVGARVAPTTSTRTAHSGNFCGQPSGANTSPPSRAWASSDTNWTRTVRVPLAGIG